MTKIANLAEHRAKRGLPPAVTPDLRPPLERIVDRYREHDVARGTLSAKAAFHLLAGACAKVIVQWGAAEGFPVDDGARFLFYVVRRREGEMLLVKVTQMGRVNGRKQVMDFLIDPDTLTAMLETVNSPLAPSERPLHTLPMSIFYRLS